MTTTQKRWICPTCGTGALAPSRPRKDDVRRYCLPCSARTGRLVERTCPALDKERAEKQTKRAARTMTKRERDRDTAIAARSAGPFDLLAEAQRFARLPALRDGIRHFPDITFRRAGRPNSRAGLGKAFTSGHCDYGRHAKIVVTIGTDEYGAVETMLHEMTHAACGHEGHSKRFWQTLRSAAKQAWPDATFDFYNARDGWQTDQAIGAGLRAAQVAPAKLTRTPKPTRSTSAGPESLSRLLQF